MQVTFGDALIGLGESTAEAQQVLSLSHEARTWHDQGNDTMARGAYQQALRIWQGIGSPVDLKDDLDYTLAIISGDPAANADHQAAAALLARAKINAIPEDASLFGPNARAGFWDGLQDGWNKVKRGDWFFGKDPADALSAATGISPGTAKAIFWVSAIGHGAYGLSQVNQLTKLFRRS